jgi:CHAD domain-containing protein
LLAAGDERRERARAQLLFYLDSERYLRFITRMGHFVATPDVGTTPIPAGKPTPFLVQHVAPRLIYTRYEAVRAYGPQMTDASPELLHALRVDLKRLRYTLEFFRPVLGTPVNQVIEETKIIQDHLGDLNDAVVALRLLDELGLPAAGVLDYRHFRQAEMARLHKSWPAAWARFERPELRQHLAQAIAVL